MSRTRPELASMRFKSSDLKLTIRKMNLEAFVKWCRRNGLPLSPLGCRHANGQTYERLRDAVSNNLMLKEYVVAYQYDVRPEFIKRACAFNHPDDCRIGYYEIDRNGKYDTYFFNKEYAMELLTLQHYSGWRTDVGLKRGGKAWKRMLGQVAIAATLLN